MEEEFIAILWQGKYYGLPGHGHRTCASKATAEAIYVTQLPPHVNLCAKCDLAITPEKQSVEKS